MKIILGVLGVVENYKNVTYEFENEKYTTPFITEAVRQKLKNEPKTILFVPESLLVSNYNNDIGKLKEKMKEKINSCKECTKPENIDNIEFVVLPSSDNWAKFQDFVIKMFCELIKIIKKLRTNEEKEEIYVCCSTGQNVYVIALLEAVRKYLTYKQLENILQNPHIIEAKIVSHPPIIQNSGAYPCEMYDFEAKAFFSLPAVKKPDKLCEKNRETDFWKAFGQDKQLRVFKENVGRCLHTLKIAYNSIRYNTSLSFYTPQILDISMDLEKIEESLFNIIDGLQRNKINVDAAKISNIFFSIAMLKSIKKFKDNLCNNATIQNIKDNFTEIYGKEWLSLGLNAHILGYELEEIRNKAKAPQSSLQGLFNAGGSSDRKRNFFAHCGFLKDYTKIEICPNNPDDYLIKWNEEKFNEIKEWVKSPEKTKIGRNPRDTK